MPSARCHKSRSIAFAIGIALFPSVLPSARIFSSFSRPLPLSLSIYLSHHSRATTQLAWQTTSANLCDSLHGTSSKLYNTSTSQFNMDSITAYLFPSQTSNSDSLKQPPPDTKTEHVEHVHDTANAEHHEHLPKGISETNDEKAKRFYIGSIDCGTTSSRFLIFNGEGTPVASHQIEFENMYPESG
jgi:hypothetical protein